MEYLNKIIQADAYEGMKLLPNESINTIITSPPYWQKRDYHDPGQLGLEADPHTFVMRLVRIMKEAYRVLRNDGTLWVNIDDTYAGSVKKRKHNDYGGLTSKGTREHYPQNTPQFFNGHFKKKDLIGIPWMFALGMRGGVLVHNQDMQRWVQLLEVAINNKNWSVVETVKKQIELSNYLRMFDKLGWYLRGDDNLE